jgi:peptide/nickel transport system substrate-binding protein
VSIRGEPTPALARGLVEWSLRVDQLGAGARYYQYDPNEAKRLLAEAGYPKGFKTQRTATAGLGRDLVDAAQLVQGYLKAVGIEAELKLQEYGAYVATTAQGKYDGMIYGPVSLALDPDGPLYGRYIPDHPQNRGYVNDPRLTAMLKEQRRTRDLEARKKIIIEVQRYIAEQQYYVYANSITVTATWQPYVKNYGPNHTFDYGCRAAALWLER